MLPCKIPLLRKDPLRRGQALVEFAIIFPLLFLLVVNAVNFGAFLFAWITVANAARVGTQYLAMGSASVSTPVPATSAQVTAVVTSDISSLLNRASLSVRVCRNTNTVIVCSGPGSRTAPNDPETANFVSVSVDVTYTFQPPVALWSFPKLGIYATLPPTTIHSRSVMRMLQ